MLQATSFAVNLLGAGSIRLGLNKEETISLENGLEAMLLGSCADVANVIADNHNYSTFVNTMTARSANLGCTYTRFINPSGITSTTHYTTVSDLARIEAYAQRNADYRRITAMQSAAMDATNVHTVHGWKVVQDNDLISGLRVLFANSDTVASIDNTVTGIDRNGYTMVCSYTTTGGVRLTAVMGGVPYDNGKGAEVCLQQMAALVQAGAKEADQSAGMVLTEANTALTAAQTAGAARALPEGSKLVVKDRIRLVTNDRMLNNGTIGLFGTAYTLSAVYYEGLQATLDSYKPGKSVEVGQLVVCGVDGEIVADGIPLYLE
jgi:D-alanyl-D-alanine carboxypeptidase